MPEMRKKEGLIVTRDFRCNPALTCPMLFGKLSGFSPLSKRNSPYWISHLIGVQSRVQNIYLLFEFKQSWSRTPRSTFLHLVTPRVQAVPCICSLWLRPGRFQTLSVRGSNTQLCLHPGRTVLSPSISQSTALIIQAHHSLPDIDLSQSMMILLLC